MSENSKIVVGLDIGTTKIACIAGRQNEHGKLEILGVGTAPSLGVERGMVANLDETVVSINKALDNLKLSNPDIAVRVVNVGIAGQHIKSIQHRGSLTRKDIQNTISQIDIDKLIDNMYHVIVPAGEEIYEVIPQDYIIDGEGGIQKPVGRNGTVIEANVHMITGKADAARNINRCVEDAGLKMDQMILEPIASSVAVLSEDEKEGGVVLVDIGGGTTDIAIFLESSLRHTAVIPLGGQIITEDIRVGCGLLKRHAESLKVQYGHAKVTEGMERSVITLPSINGKESREVSLMNLAGIIQARMEEILSLVAYEIEASGLKRRLHSGIIITGGGSQLKHIEQLCEYVTGMSTRIGSPNVHLANTDKFNMLSSPIYATGIGLVMDGFEDTIKKYSEETVVADVKTEKVKEPKAPKEPKVTQRKLGSFFTNLMGKSMEFMNEPED